MHILHGLNTKTALEHLVFLSNKNIVTVSRELKITPQQFTDWIKHRRPIPAERLVQLSRYFNIPTNIIVDSKRYTKRLSVLDSIELEILVLTNQSKGSTADSKLEYSINVLKKERQNQIRITRLSALLEKNDMGIMNKIDQFLDKMEEE